MNEEMKFCQSCGMPMQAAGDFGTETDGSPSGEYCVYCYKGGTFTAACTMEEMIRHCAQFHEQFRDENGKSYTFEESFTDAQFSQKQEYEADEYGFEFSVKHGFSPYAMGNSLNKLVELSKGAKASTVQKMFSSHPDSEKRAARMKEKADAHAAAQQQ